MNVLLGISIDSAPLLGALAAMAVASVVLVGRQASRRMVSALPFLRHVALRCDAATESCATSSPRGLHAVSRLRSALIASGWTVSVVIFATFLAGCKGGH